MAVHVVGLSHHTTPLAVRERCVVEGDALTPALHELQAAGTAEVVILSTCNRTEIYTRDDAADSQSGANQSGANGDANRDDAASTALHRHADVARAWLQRRARLSDAEAERFLYTHQDAQAAQHLFRVVSGIDSLVLGEPQIQGQVKHAYENATRRNGGPRAVGATLARLFETALFVGGRVRTETRLGTGAASVPSAAVALARKIFGSLKGRRTLILGAGEMSELTLRCLLAEGVSSVVVANRTEQRALDLVARHGGVAATFGRLPALLQDADIVACATAAPHHIVTESMVARVFREGRREPMLLLDIALPRDVDPVVGGISGVFLYDVDDLHQVVDGTFAQRRGEIAAAEGIIDEGVAEFVNWYRGRSVVPVIQAMRGRAEDMRRAELERAVRSLHLGPEAEAALDMVTKQMLNKVLHEPTTRLRQAAAEGRDDDVAVARRLWGLD